MRNDPVRARLGVVQELKPHQWAGLVAVVAKTAERRSWPSSEAASMLSMLGLDKTAARTAKEALKRSQRLRWAQSLAPKPSRPRTAALEAIPVPSVPPGPARLRDGRFAVMPTCIAGLHANTPENRQMRKDGRSNCRPCAVERKRRNRA